MSELDSLKFNKSQASIGAQSTIKRGSEMGKSYLMQSNRMSYIFQKLPQNLQSYVIDEIINAEEKADQSRLNLKSTNIYNKQYPNKVGKLKIQIDNWLCCLFRNGFTMEIKPCKLDQNVLQVGVTGYNDTSYICFDVLSVKISRQKNNRIRIQAKQNQQVYFIFEAQNEEEFQSWYKVLQQSILNSCGNQFNLKQVLKISNFQKEQYVLQKDFVSRCNCGDILLFKDQHTMAKLQRLTTSSQYDHIGVVLKNKKNQVFIFQSTTSAGVSIMEWKHFIKYRLYQFVDKIAWRELKIDLKKNDIQTIQEFVYSTINKEFGLSIGRLMVMESIVHPEEKLNQGKDSYFCSQLVAALYKRLGLVQKQKSTSQYWPVTFSKDLPLLKGQLGNLKTIIFQNDILSQTPI